MYEEKMHIEILKIIKYLIKKKKGEKIIKIEFNYLKQFNIERFIQHKKDIFLKDIIHNIQILFNGIDIIYMFDVQNFMSYNNVALNSYFPFYDHKTLENQEENNSLDQDDNNNND